jgi:hypothetical protein
MKFHNMFETEQITVLAGQLFTDEPYVGISHATGSLTFVWTMSIEQARALGRHLVSLAEADDERVYKLVQALVEVPA